MYNFRSWHFSSNETRRQYQSLALFLSWRAATSSFHTQPKFFIIASHQVHDFLCQRTVNRIYIITHWLWCVEVSISRKRMSVFTAFSHFSWCLLSSKFWCPEKEIHDRESNFPKRPAVQLTTRNVCATQALSLYFNVMNATWELHLILCNAEITSTNRTHKHLNKQHLRSTQCISE